MGARSDFSFETMEVDQDHMQCLVKSEPGISPLAIVHRWNQESTARLWRTYEKDLQRHFWKERTFWSDVYFGSWPLWGHAGCLLAVAKSLL